MRVLLTSIVLLSASAHACPLKWGDAGAKTTEELRALKASGDVDCVFVAGWELALRAGLEYRNDEKVELLLDLEQRCWDPSTLSARSRVGCALVSGELSKRLGLRMWGRRQAYIQNAQLSGEFTGDGAGERAEIRWVRAHLERTTPMDLRPNYRSTLVGLEWLSRARLDPWEKYWKADTLYRQGNPDAAREAADEARASSTVIAGLPRSRWMKPADGICGGWNPLMGFSAWAGFSAGVGYCSANTSGREHLESLTLQATTRGNVSGRVLASDAHVLRPMRLSASVVAAQVYEDYYGLGFLSPAPRDSWRTRRLDGLVLVDIPFRQDWEGAAVSVGWKASILESELPATVVLPATVRSFTGPVLSAVVDHLDSDFLAKAGWRIGVTTFLGIAPRLFAQHLLQYRHVLGWNVRTRTKIDLVALFNTGAMPFHAWPRLTGTLALPAVRPYRYVHERIGTLSISQEFDLIRSFSLIPSVSMAAGTSGGRTVDSAMGIALGGAWLFSSERRSALRGAAGFFGGEWAIQAGADAGF